MKTEREQVFEYLDELRESGVTNMFGAHKFIQKKFKHLPILTCKRYLMAWMTTYGEGQNDG